MSKKNDTQLKIITAKHWLILAALLIICAAAALWMFFGTVRVTYERPGVILTDYSEYHNQVFFLLPMDLWSEVSMNTPSEIESLTFSKSWYGILTGKPSYFGKESLSSEDLHKIADNNVVESFLMDSDQPMVIGVIDLDCSETDELIWTGGTAQNRPNPNLDLCKVRLIIREQRPVDSLF
ncbi:MAG: hypothetical protein Q4F31_08465 [Eubacteriales bacterium]|nr:hypothetical protein [Eubacteriales bacterium]